MRCGVLTDGCGECLGTRGAHELTRGTCYLTSAASDWALGRDLAHALRGVSERVTRVSGHSGHTLVKPWRVLSHVLGGCLGTGR